MRKLIIKYYQKIRIRLFRYLSTNKNISGQPNIKQPVHFAGNGKIVFGNNVQIGYLPSPYFYSGYSYIESRNEDAIIIFGDRVVTNNNLMVVSDSGRICFGDNVIIGSNVEIINSDFHGLHPNNRNSGDHKSFDVIIEENVFIGSNVRILKGVTVGKNSIISNSSVVYHNIEENSIVGGNPASLLKKLQL